MLGEKTLEVSELFWILKHLHESKGYLVFFIHVQSLEASRSSATQLNLIDYLHALFDVSNVWVWTIVDINLSLCTYSELELLQQRHSSVYDILLINPVLVIVPRLFVELQQDFLIEARNPRICLQLIKHRWLLLLFISLELLFYLVLFDFDINLELQLHSFKHLISFLGLLFLLLFLYGVVHILMKYAIDLRNRQGKLWFFRGLSPASLMWGRCPGLALRVKPRTTRRDPRKLLRSSHFAGPALKLLSIWPWIRLKPPKYDLVLLTVNLLLFVANSPLLHVLTSYTKPLADWLLLLIIRRIRC